MHIRQACDEGSKTDPRLGEPAVMNNLVEGNDGPPPDLALDESFWDFTATNNFDIRGFGGGFFPGQSG